MVAVSPYGHYHIPFENYVGGKLIKYGWGPGWGVGAATGVQGHLW